MASAAFAFGTLSTLGVGVIVRSTTRTGRNIIQSAWAGRQDRADGLIRIAEDCLNVGRSVGQVIGGLVDLLEIGPAPMNMPTEISIMTADGHT